MSSWAPYLADLFWTFVAVYLIFAVFGNPWSKGNDG